MYGTKIFSLHEVISLTLKKQSKFRKDLAHFEEKVNDNMLNF